MRRALKVRHGPSAHGCRIALLCLGITVGVASAQAQTRPTVVDLPNTLATVEPDAQWSVIPTVGETAIAAWEHLSGVRAVVVRISVPNPAAWNSKTRTTYVSEVERGFAAAPGYRKQSRRLGIVGGVPTFDLRFLRKIEGKREAVAARLLLFRTYTLVLAVSGAPRQMQAARRATTRLIQSFAQPAPQEPALE